jgi:hypothetical protein
VCNYGEILILDADGESDVFTCKVPMSWLENYENLIIAPADDDGIWREYILIPTTYYLNDLESLNYQTANYYIYNTKEADFELGAAEYADVPGGRMYRFTYTNTEPIRIDFYAREEEDLEDETHTMSWAWSLWSWEKQEAGDNVSYYFVSNHTLEEYDFVYLPVFFPDSYSPDVMIYIWPGHHAWIPGAYGPGTDIYF